MRRTGRRGWPGVLLLLGLLAAAGAEAAAAPAWLSPFGWRNNVTFDAVAGTVTLQGNTSSSGSLAPSAGLLSLAAYDGDVTLTATFNDYKILQSGYQAQIALFMAPSSFSLGDYRSWPDAAVLDTQQHVYARAKIYTADIPNYTWASLRSALNGSSSSIGVPGSWTATGVFSLSRKGDSCAGSLKLGAAAAVPFPPVKCSTGPVVVGVQMLFGFAFSATLTGISISFDSSQPVFRAPPPAPPSPPPPPPPPPPPQPTVSTGTTAASWNDLFASSNNVTFDAVAGTVTLQGNTSSSGSLAPSAGLLSLAAYDGDVTLTATFNDYKILQSGYQAQIALFMAPSSFSLGDYRSWPDAAVLDTQQHVYARAKIYTADIPNYTWASLRSALNGSSSSIGVPGSWTATGVFSLSRKGDSCAGSLKLGAAAAVPFPPVKCSTGPVVVGVQMLFGFAFSATLTGISISFDSSQPVFRAPPPAPPSPPPPPPPPPPPQPTVSTGTTAASWNDLFASSNNVTFDAVAGTVTLQGNTSSSGSLAPSAGLLSLAAYDGDVTLTATFNDYKILQSGYQAQIALFMAPSSFSLGDYRSWPDAAVLDTQQHVYARAKIYTADIPNYTWASLRSALNGSSSSIGVPGSWTATGVFSLSRKGDSCAGSLKLGAAAAVPFPPVKCSTGPVVVGVQMLFGFAFSATLTGISISFDSSQPVFRAPPPAPPSPPPPPPPPPPPQPTVSTGTTAASWNDLFASSNNVTFDAVAGTVTLQGNTSSSGSLAPSAGLLSLAAYDGDVTLTATFNDYKILQSGYQAQIALFMAPSSFSLGDYRSWPDAAVLDTQQHVYARAKIYTADIPNYTWASLRSALNGSSSSIGVPGSWTATGVFSLSRKGDSCAGSLKLGAAAAVPFPPVKCSTGPVVVGVQMLFGFAFSATLTGISISFDSSQPVFRAPPPAPPSPPPPPPPPPPPQPTVSTGTTAASWNDLFASRNNVTFNSAAGTMTLQGFTDSPSRLAPSAGLLSLNAFDGDVTVTAAISGYQLLQDAYQAAISLFLARTDYTLKDIRGWEETGLDTAAPRQVAWVRATTHKTLPGVTYSKLSGLAGSKVIEGINHGGQLQQGAISISRKGETCSGSIQVLGSPPVPFSEPVSCGSGQVLVGLQILYGYNFSVGVSSISISFSDGGRIITPSPAPPSPPSPPPPPPPPPSPPACPVTPASPVSFQSGPNTYQPKGVGGGGAMSSFSISPFSDLWFVGTDMGSLFRSTDQGATWAPVSHSQMKMTTDMPFVGPVGFSADGSTLFFAPCWLSGSPCVAKRSTDGGVTWTAMDVNAKGARVFNQAQLPYNNARPIRYWTCSTKLPDLCYAATVGGLDRTTDKGVSWAPVAHALLTGMDSRGSFIDHATTPPTVYSATPNGIYSWPDGSPESLTTVVSGGVHSFAGGRDATGLTLVYVDTDSAYCEQAMSAVSWTNSELKANTLNTCGRMHISTDGGQTFAADQHYSYKVVMAVNNGRVVYSHPSRSWDRNYGVRIFKSIISTGDAGLVSATTTKVFDQVNLDDHYALWPSDRLEYSAIGLDVGYWDGGYYSFAVNALNASEAGGSENFFLHVTRDGGTRWEAPFTRFRDCGSRSGGKRWSSTGLEPTNFYTVAVHPSAPNIIYAGAADIRGVVSDDGGDSWRVIDPRRQAAPNSIYSFAFDADKPNRVFVATAKWHDWPHAWYANPLNGAGGIFMSDDLGRSFTRVGSTSTSACAGCNDMFNDFLAVAYDAEGGYVYAGGHINGIARIKLGVDSAWTWVNNGLLLPGVDDLWQNETIVPKIRIDPENGDVYCLLTGNRAIGSPRNMLNQPRTGIYRMPRGGSQFTLLRGRVLPPSAFPSSTPWQYPTSFDVDWASGSPGARSHMLLTDFINNGQPAGSAGVWKTSDGGDTWRFVQQADWPTDVFFDRSHPGRVYLGGVRSSSPWGISGPGGWGFGGFMFSDDGGDSFKLDEAMPYQDGTNSAAVDPANPCQMYYATGGGGLLYGPAPPGLPGC